MYNFSSGKSLLPQHVFNIPGSLKLKHITTSTYEIEEWSFLGGPIVSRCLARFNTSKNLTRSILITPLRSPALRLITMILCQHLAYSSWLGHLLTNMSSSRLSLRSGKIARNTQTQLVYSFSDDAMTRKRTVPVIQNRNLWCTWKLSSLRACCGSMFDPFLPIHPR